MFDAYIFRYGSIYSVKKFAVIDVSPDVHGDSFPARYTYF
jgi:hypothetical protein